MNRFAAIEPELAAWREQGLTPRFFLRDDDAVEPGAALDRLIALIRRFELPLLLAVVPAQAVRALAARLADEPLVTPCVHGYAHQRHTPEREKAVELGGGRPVDAVLAELRAGQERLGVLFGNRLSGILVPPWNRIDPNVAARVHECGFTALSTASWQRTGTSLPELNTHIDIIDWRGERSGRDCAWVAAELLRRLQQARERGGAPLGILSHHLVHDERAWNTLETLIDYLNVGAGLEFAPADTLAAELANAAQ